MEAGNNWVRCGSRQLIRSISFYPTSRFNRPFDIYLVFFVLEMEALSRIPNRELSFARLIHHNSIQLIILLALSSSTSDCTPVGFYSLKKLRLSRQFASTKSWELYPDKRRAAYDEPTKQYLLQHGIQLSLDARVARSTFSSPAGSPSYPLIWVMSADLCVGGPHRFDTIPRASIYKKFS